MIKKLLLLFFLFPVITCYSQNDSLLTIAEIYDFEKGDKFIFKNTAADFREYDLGNYTIIITDKIVTPDSLTYSVERNFKDKITKEYIRFSKEDLKKYVSSQADEISISSEFDSRIVNGVKWWDPSGFEPIFYHNKYAKGLGQVYISTQEVGGQSATKLIYFKKGDTEWEHPVLNTTEHLSLPTQIKLFPIPIIDEVTIESASYFKDGTVLSIYNPDGVKLLERQVSGTTSSIFDLNHFPSGIYFLQIKSGDSVTSKTLVKN